MDRSEFILLSGTVDDALRMYNLVDDETREQLYDLIKGTFDTRATIQVRARNQEHADELIRLSKFASAPPRSLTVRSVSRPGVYHTIQFQGGMPVSCSCEAFKFSDSKPCRHIVDVVMRGLRPRDEPTA